MKKNLMLILITCIMLLTGLAIQAANNSIADVLKNPAKYKYAKKTVSFHGYVTNSMVPTGDSPLSEIKGEYDLTDNSGQTIHVKSKSNPPANGVTRTVRGTLEFPAKALPVLMEKNGLFGAIPPLYIALSVLVLLAIVLVILIFRKPAPAVLMAGVAGMTASAQFAASGPPIVSPAPTGTRDSGIGATCPRCGVKNSPDANFCEGCREPLRSVSAPASKNTVAQSGQEVRPSSKATVAIPAAPEERPVADLTVIEGDRYGTRYALKKEKQKIGRREDMEIRLADETVSREHACIWWQDGFFYLQDEASTSGTMVNGQKISRQQLMDNDAIEIGKTKLIFRVIPGTPVK